MATSPLAQCSAIIPKLIRSVGEEAGPRGWLLVPFVDWPYNEKAPKGFFRQFI